MLLPERRVTGAHPAETAKCVVVPPPHRVAALGKQRGEHFGGGAGQRQQDGRIRRFLRRLRRWLVLRRRVRVVRRSSLGELMHQQVEFATRVIALAVDQGEAFGDEPHMRGGRFGRARRQLEGRRAQPGA